MKMIYVICSVDRDKYVSLVQAYQDKLEALNECDELNKSVGCDEGIIYWVGHCEYRQYLGD